MQEEKKKQLNGLVLLCEENSRIEKVIRNDFNLDKSETEGKLLTQLFEKEAIPKVLNFLIQIKKKQHCLRLFAGAAG